MNKSDPLTKVFDVLKARSRERANLNLELEEELMSVFDQQKLSRSRYVRLATAGVLVLLVTGAAAEAATGFISTKIKSVMLNTGSGPKPVTEYQTKENPDGSVTVTVGLTEGATSGTVTVDATGNSE